MMTPRALLRRLRTLFRRDRLERDLADELAFHLDREADRLRSGGLAPEQARQRAAARFGSVALAADRCRDERRVTLAESIMWRVASDLRYGIRQWAHRPWSALTMVGVLSLGIGFSSAIFALVTSLRTSPPAGIARDLSLVRIRGIDDRRAAGTRTGREFSYDEYRAYADNRQTFAAVAGWTSTDVSLDTGEGGPALTSGAATFVTAEYFRVLGLTFSRGAGLPADTTDGQLAPSGVISHALWARLFSSASDVVGRTLKVNDVPITIAGVAPPAFIGARTGGSAMRVWLPLDTRVLVHRTPQSDRIQDAAVFGLIARLQPGADVARATTDVQALASRFLASGVSGSRSGHTADVVPLLASNYFPPSGESPGIAGRVATIAIPVIVLLITCTNVSTILAGIALSRRREIAVRLSLGASRRRIVGQLLTESALLAVIGGAVGLLVLWILVAVSQATVLDTPLTVDTRAVLFTFVFSIAVGVAFGLSPALHATRAPVSSVLLESDPTVLRSRLQATLVVVQIAVTQPALLAMGALLLELNQDLRQQTLSGVGDRVVEVRFNTNPRYGAMDNGRETAIRRVQEHLEAMPGVVAVAAQDDFRDTARVTSVSGEVASARGVSGDVRATVHGAPPGYFSLMDMAIIRGRDFTSADVRFDRNVVITSALADRLWGTQDVVGRSLTSDSGRQDRSGTFTIVGVVSTSPGVDESRRQLGLFVPNLDLTSHLLVRTTMAAASQLGAIRAAAHAAAPELPVTSARSLEAIEAEARSGMMTGVLAAGVTGTIALLLAAIGLYSVVAVAVSQRVREIGVRTALGSDGRRIVRLFVRRGVAVTLVGIGIGLISSVLVVRIVSAMEGRPIPANLGALAAAVAVFVLSIATLAVWIPARRAARLDPLRALRHGA